MPSVVGPIKFLSYRSGTDPVRVHTKLPRTKGSVSNLDRPKHKHPTPFLLRSRQQEEEITPSP